MKHTLILLGLCAPFFCSPASASPVVEKRDWTETFEVGSAPSLSVSNIWGDVTVTAGASDRIEMTIESVRQADDQANFERSLEQIPLAIEQNGDEVAFVVGRQQNWRNAQRCRGCRLHVNLIVTVPANTLLDVSTVNDGNIIINGVRNRVMANNVNGSVSSRGLTQCDEIETVNGDIDVQFDKNPASDCRIETLNGDIDLMLSADASVNFAIEVSNGKMRSDLDLSPLAVPAAVEHEVRNGRHFYNIEQSAGLQLGRGGHLLKLKSFNGDITVARSQ